MDKRKPLERLRERRVAPAMTDPDPTDPSTLKLYGELATWWPLLSPPGEYVEEADFYARTLVVACDSPPSTLLELGSGGGHNAYYMKPRFAEVTLVDLSPGMLEMSRALNPDCVHHVGDMRTVRLGTAFDAVFIHDAICYMTTVDDLERAVRTAFEHLRPGGAALFAPDVVRENFRVGIDSGGLDAGDAPTSRGIRYFGWTWDPDPTDSTYIVDYAYLLREEGGAVRVEHDRHIEGLFSRDQWLGVLRRVGFEARSVPFDHSDVPPGSYEVFVARRPRG
jgi:SAM-dependent methyltransferase